MNKLTISGYLNSKYISLERISKKKAQKLFKDGQTIYIQSSKFTPFGFWSPAQQININDNTFMQGMYNFNNYVNSFEYYNCSYEQGYYASFYIECE